MVNLASPIVGVPYPIFVTALVVGHLPINFISVKVRRERRGGEGRAGLSGWGRASDDTCRPANDRISQPTDQHSTHLA